MLEHCIIKLKVLSLLSLILLKFLSMLKNKFLYIGILAILFTSCGSLNIFSKKKKAQPAKTEVKAKTPPPVNGLKAYKDVINKDAKSRSSFITVHQVKDKYYFELADSIMNRDILIVNRISKAPVNRIKSLVGYPGDYVGENVIRFEKAANNKVFIRMISYIEQAKDSLGMYEAVKNSNIQPIIEGFNIESIKKDTTNNSQSLVIDVTKFLGADNELLSFGNRTKKQRGIGPNFADRSYIDTVKVFPINVEVRTVKTFGQVPPQDMPPMIAKNWSTDPLTYELNSSFVLLPKEPMKPRLFDPRVGYFAVRYTDFDSNPQGIEYKSKITRWRLEPRDEDLERYVKGELVEPKKQIVFYIDPATPKKWVKYLKAGVDDWNIAFEQAGFKNAIVGLEAPTDDPEWSLEDARHSAIVYKPSDIPNASGPHVHDPRSGEIIESHINWYHNVMLLLRNWYMIQAGPNDKRAQKLQFDDELMGELIRFVSSHEVGHTLGLRHNFGSSATVPVEKLRDKAWVEANGHTPSIMDYARFNYVAQPEDNISDAGIFPRIGIYDKWAIEWGYRYLPEYKTPEDEIPSSNRDIIKKLNTDIRYTFGTETDPNDPRNQSEDLGDNSMLASEYGIKNLKRIVPNIIEWTSEPNKGYQEASNIYSQVVTQYNRYMGHVAKNIAGAYVTPVTVEQSTSAVEFVPASKQKEAVQFLNKNLFTTPTWLIDTNLFSKAGIDPIGRIEASQKVILTRLLSQATLSKMALDETYNGSSAYTSLNLFRDLQPVIWAELTNGKSVDIYKRNLQKNYVSLLIKLAGLEKGPQSSTSLTETTSIARGHLTELNQKIKSAASSASGIKKYHFQELAAEIDKALSTK